MQRAEQLYGLDGELSQTGIPRPPLSSFAHGAAGIAYLWLRHAQLNDEPHALGVAALWISLAERNIDSADAFISASSRVFPDGGRPVDTSLYLGEPGIWCVAALVYGAQGDLASVQRALDRFGAIAEPPSFHYLDAILGAASLLLGTAVLVEALGDPSARSIIPLGEELETRLTPALEQPMEVEGHRFLGAAHGPSGVVHSLLRWCQATGTGPSPTVIEALERLASSRLESGLWPREEATSEVWRGWCHGSAGWVQLWTLAYEVLGDSAYIDLTERAARHAVGADADFGGAGLCCGLLGVAYAAVALHRSTGEQEWLDHARRLIAEVRRAEVGPAFPEHSLWRGDVGLALLDLELTQPERAAMPLYRALT